MVLPFLNKGVKLYSTKAPKYLPKPALTVASKEKCCKLKREEVLLVNLSPFTYSPVFVLVEAKRHAPIIPAAK